MKKILLVDDEESFRKMMRLMLKNQAYELCEASNGAEAKQVISSTDIDLIATDLAMPLMDGIDLIVDLKNDAPHLPIIAISGGGGDYPEVAVLIGAENILRKPFSGEDLRQAISCLLDKGSEGSDV